jgi:hypothetical protein
MPSDIFKKRVKGKKLNIELISEVSSYFQTSLTATFLRYKDLGEFPVMVIFIEDGIIRWKASSSDFPFQWLPVETKVPAWTVAGDFFTGKGIEEKPVMVQAIEWFPEDFQIAGNEKMKLWEQCFVIPNNGLISCLWTS